VRSDALLFLAAQAAVLTVTRAPSVLNARALGLLGGISTNLQIHGAVYIIPAFVYFVFRSRITATGLRLSCVVALTGAIAVVASFIPNNVSLFVPRSIFVSTTTI
jgi:hypothetical protein